MLTQTPTQASKGSHERPGTPFAVDLSLLGRHIRVQEWSDPSVNESIALCFEEEARAHQRLRDRRPDLVVSISPVDRCSQAPPRIKRVTTRPLTEIHQLEMVSTHLPGVIAGALGRWAVGTTTRYLPFHAAAVAKDGRAALMPGDSRTGKTTLTAGLARRGFEILSDEIGAIACHNGLIEAYPRALSIREDTLALLGITNPPYAPRSEDGAWLVRAGDFGARRASRAGDPVLVVCPEWSASHSTRLEPLRPGQAVLSLMATACSAPGLRVKAFEAALELSRRVPAYRLTFSELPQALDLLEAALQAASLP